MAEINKAIRGTNDILPNESKKWQFVEKKMLETAALFGFSEIRVPVFEHTEVFTRSVGDATDVVQKEMYTFLDKGDRSITLRPELTAGVIRSVIEHGLFNEALPLKTCYIGGCYRYEKPQAGRLREFHQFGVECIGAADPSADAEVILLAKSVLDEIGVKNLRLELNSIGCPTCRLEYHKALKSYFESKKADLCNTCLERLDRNPMRILDCKCPSCQEIAKDAPVMIEFLCDECAEHFEIVKSHLDAAKIEYILNPTIVRGLDYYTRTVFEFVSNDIGAQSTVCGGGRYDGLISQMGGPQTPSLGFAMGIERLMLVLENQKGLELPEMTVDVYIAPMCEKAKTEATALCMKLRAEGFSAVTDIVGRSFKAQMKYANKIGVKYLLVLGDNELDTKKCNLKNMQSGEQYEVDFPDGVISKIYDLQIENAMSDLTDSLIDAENGLKF